MSRTLLIPALVIALFLSPTPASPAEDLGGDRPDFTESPSVVPAGAVQFELGAIWERLSGRAERLGLPELLIRWGLGHGWEARVELPGWERQRGGGRFSTHTDAAVGLKRALGEVLPGTDMALLAMVSLPVGGEAATSDRFDPLVALAWEHELAARWALGGQTTTAWTSEERAQVFTIGQTLVVTHEPAPGWGLFLEGALERRRGDSASLILHQGVTRAVGPRTQLDLHWGAGLNRASPRFFVGVGCIHRW